MNAGTEQDVLMFNLLVIIPQADSSVQHSSSLIFVHSFIHMKATLLVNLPTSSVCGHFSIMQIQAMWNKNYEIIIRSTFIPIQTGSKVSCYISTAVFFILEPILFNGGLDVDKTELSMF